MGPVIGGLLAEPAKRFPSTFGTDSFWVSYPFFLPNVVVTVILVMTWLVGFLFLKETHPKFTQQSDIGRGAVSTLINILHNAKLFKPKFGYVAVQDDREDIGSTQILPAANSNAEEGEVEVEVELAEFDRTNNFDDNEVSLPSATLQKPYTMQVILQILSVSILAYHKIASDTLIPVFLASPSSQFEADRSIMRLLNLSGGFGMSTASIGNVLLTQAVIATIVQLAVVPIIIKRFGALRTYRWTLFVFPWMYCLTPFVIKLPMPISVIALLLDLWIKVLLVALGYVCSAIL